MNIRGHTLNWRTEGFDEYKGPHVKLYLPPLVSTQIKYVETSAKHRIHVDKAFHDLVRVIRQAQKPTPVKTKKKKKTCNIL